jgi:hypothetical protein
MHCGKCGCEAKSGTRFCTRCDAEIEIDPRDSRAELSLSAPEQGKVSDTPTTSGSQTDLSGIGGWLYFFCIRNTVLAPLFNTSAIFASSTDLLTKTIFCLIVLLEFTAGVLVWRISLRAFRFLKIYFGVLVFLGLAFITIGGLSPEDAQGGSMSLIKFGSEELLWAIGWYMYFRRSRRIKATFGRNM